MFVSVVLLGILANDSPGQEADPFGHDPYGSPKQPTTPNDIQKAIDELREHLNTKSRDYVKAVAESQEGIATNAKLTKAATELAVLQSKLQKLVQQQNQLMTAAAQMKDNSKRRRRSRGGYGGGYGGYGGGGYGGGGYGGGDGGGYGGGGGSYAASSGIDGYGGYDAAGREEDYLNTEDVDVQLQSHTRVLAHQLRTADESQQATVTRAMRKVLGELFERRMKQRESHLQQLEDRLTKLRAQFKRQLDAKNEVIDLRVKTLINEAQGIGF